MKKFFPGVILFVILIATMAATYPWVRIPNLTPGRFVVLDSVGILTNTAAATGSGGPALENSPTLTTPTINGVVPGTVLAKVTSNLSLGGSQPASDGSVQVFYIHDLDTGFKWYNVGTIASPNWEIQ